MRTASWTWRWPTTSRAAPCRCCWGRGREEWGTRPSAHAWRIRRRALARSIVAGDWNEDGITDLAVTNNVASGTVTVLLGQGANGIGNGTFAAGVAYGAGSTPLWLASADLNHDGIEDLVVTNYVVSGTVSVLLGQGTGGKGTARSGARRAHGGRPAVRSGGGDFNEDGIVDVAVTNFDNVASGAPREAGRRGVERDVRRTGAVPGWDRRREGLAVGDLNTDGIADLMVANRIDGTASLLLGKGTGGVGDGTFEEGAAFSSGQYPQGCRDRRLPRGRRARLGGA